MIHLIPSILPTVKMANTSQPKTPKSELNSDGDAFEVKDPLQPESTDIDERMSTASLSLLLIPNLLTHPQHAITRRP
jgi:hypothetical protein